jgi:peptide/nickel transport system substrate-binding protein
MRDAQMVQPRHLLAVLLLLVAVFAAPSAVARDTETLTFAIADLPPAFGNPYMTGGWPGLAIWPAIYDGLAELQADGSLAPALALSWAFEDEYTWVFRLREGVRFSNGEPFNAHTVVQVMAYLLQPESARLSIVREVRNIESVAARDDFTLVVKTREPDRFTPAKFAAVKMIEPKAFAALGAEAYARAPIGTGPYQVESWGLNEIRMRENPFAWRRPIVKRLRIVALPEVGARVKALQSDTVDVALQLGPDDIAQVEAAGDVMTSNYLGGIVAMPFILVRDTPFNDVRVRRAVNYAVNRQAIVDVLLAGRTRLASQTTAHTAIGYVEALEPYPYDPEKAKALLREAGFPNGFTFTTDVYVTGANADAAVYQQVANDLAQVGLTMKLNVMAFPRYTEALYQGNWTGEMMLFSYGTLPSMDPIATYQYHSCAWVKPWVCDPALQSLIERTQTTFDLDARTALVQELLRRTHDEPLGLYLHETNRFDGVAPRVQGYRAPFGFPHYWEMSLAR